MEQKSLCFLTTFKPRSPSASCLFRLFPLYLPRQSPLPLFGFQKIPALTRQEEKKIQRLPLTKEEFGGGTAQGKKLWAVLVTPRATGEASAQTHLCCIQNVLWEGRGGITPRRGCLGHVQKQWKLVGFLGK